MAKFFGIFVDLFRNQRRLCQAAQWITVLVMEKGIVWVIVGNNG